MTSAIHDGVNLLEGDSTRFDDNKSKKLDDFGSKLSKVQLAQKGKAVWRKQQKKEPHEKVNSKANNKKKQTGPQKS